MRLLGGGVTCNCVLKIPDGGAILPALLPEEEKRERFPPQPSARALALERQRTEATKRLVKKKEVESELRGLAEDYEGERSLLRHLIEEISVEAADKAVVVVLEGPVQWHLDGRVTIMSVRVLGKWANQASG
ncbi:hypothetical protein FOZ62_002367, partial [Perkinsus olseni]